MVWHMSNLELLTTSEVARSLGITRQAVLARVASGSLVPTMKLPTSTGAYLFSVDDVADAAACA